MHFTCAGEFRFLATFRNVSKLFIFKLSYERREVPSIFFVKQEISESNYKRTVYIISIVCLSVCLWHNFVYGCLRELKKLATCGLRKNVGISFLYKSYISDFKNPFQKTSEHNIVVIITWIYHLSRARDPRFPLNVRLSSLLIIFTFKFQKSFPKNEWT